jgi:sugar phosphate isomerase/epimerase
MNTEFSRRDFGKMAFAGIPMASAMLLNSDLFAADKPNSKFKGVQIGVITYSFNGMAAADIIPSMVTIGLSAVELMSSHAESLAGAPAAGGFGGGGRGPAGPQTLGADGLLPRCESMQMVPTPAAEGAAGGAGRGRGPLTPEQQAAQQKLKDWRAAATPETWKGVRKQFDDAGIALRILCYNMAANISDDDIDYAFRMARDLGVEAISSTSTVPVAKRVAPFADKYKIKWGGHGHDDIHDPIQFSTPESFDTIMSYSPYIGVNLDIGHFTAAGYDAVAYIKQHHARITNLHLKDRKKSSDFNADRTAIPLNNFPWGQGDTPIKAVLQLVSQEKYTFPADIEYEYECRAAGTPVEEIAKCLAFAKNCLT